MAGPEYLGTGASADAILIDGRADDRVAVTDRGLLYGDGLFETIAVRDGRPCLWDAHLTRLARGAARLDLPMPAPGLWRQEARRLLAGQDTAILKLLLTRGRGPRGYAPPPSPMPTRILIRSPAPAGGFPCPGSHAGTHAGTNAGAGITARLCRTPLGLNPALAGIKHLNRLEQVLARAEWTDPAIAEGLQCDVEGHLICGTASNLFVLRGGDLLTPRLDGCGVAGTLRAVVFREARRLGLALRDVRLRPRHLLNADGAFVTNALTGIRPIHRLAERVFDPAVLPASLVAAVHCRAFTPETDW